ncbi:ThiF family adenylyltransferase, partial [Pseudomonas aeruginosa]
SAALDKDSPDAAVAAVDLVLDCTDNFATREAVNVACVRAGKPHQRTDHAGLAAGQLGLAAVPVEAVVAGAFVAAGIEYRKLAL